jgi:apolipoprotein N-acyltransferase
MSASLLAFSSGILLGLGWLLPSSYPCAILGWLFALSFGQLLLVPEQRKVRALLPFSAGAVAISIGFWWLVPTIADFGGFPLPAALLLFVLFVLASSLQFALCAWLFRLLPTQLDRLALRLPLAWTLSELFTPRLFPWQLGHMQLAFLPLVQIAEFSSVAGISFLMMWVSSGLLQLRRFKLGALLSTLALALSICFGLSRMQQFALTVQQAPRQEVAVLQANISLLEKGDQRLFARNSERYAALTRSVLRNSQAAGDLLVVWPESVIVDLIDAQVGEVRLDRRLPRFSQPVNMLIGSLTHSAHTAVHNSALAIYTSGEVPTPYHKRILMPFGEYTPFQHAPFPLRQLHHFMRRVNNNLENLTPGKSSRVFEFPRSDGEKTKVGPLICYEDIVSEMARESVERGAEVLINLTNDAWFGNTQAPHQHHLIAAFRSIENRRFLVRSTNSGLTAIVDPLGRTLESLPVFSEGSMLSSVALLRYKTVYSQGYALWFWNGVALLVLLLVCLAALARRQGKHPEFPSGNFQAGITNRD